MRIKLDLAGKKFGRLLALRDVGKSGSAFLWECQCECGNKSVVRAHRLASGDTQSCGCLRSIACGLNKKTHGLSKTPEFRIWVHMRRRCESLTVGHYKNYGGRGIKVCDRWQLFENFYKDMGPRPLGKSLDRIDNNGDYDPVNCRWATAVEQGRNRRTNLTVEFEGKSICVSELAEITGLNYDALLDRVHRGDKGGRLVRPLRKGSYVK